MYRHAQRFWGASGDFWDTQWARIHAYFDGNALTLSLVGILVVLIIYLTANALLIVVDLTRWQPLYQYKVQPNEKVGVFACAPRLHAHSWTRVVCARHFYACCSI